jgi:dihydroxy-acid dehydratase
MRMEETSSFEEYYDKLIYDLRLTVLHGMGYRERDARRPFIAVMHGWNEISPGHIHLRPIAEQVKIGVAQGGGTPAEVIVPGICGSVSGGAPSFRYNIPYRDFAAAMAEIMLELGRFDGAVLIPTCDNVVPAYLMAAARVNIPSLLLTGGYMRPGCYQGQTLTIQDTQRAHGRYLKGDITEQDVDNIVRHACGGPGACPEMGTANTMCSVGEVLGMSFPGNATIPADSPVLSHLAKTVGERAVELVRDGARPSDIMTEKAFHNAMKLVLAVGGSTNAVIHLPAMAKELGIEIPLDLWDKLSRETPFICSIRPNNPAYTMADLERAGGIPAVIKEMGELLDLDLPTVTGRTLEQNVAQARVFDRKIIRPLRDPFSREGAIAVLRGNLAPEGAIVKQSAISESMLCRTGPAKVFDSEEEAIEGLQSGRIARGDVVVVRYEGPKGSPGAREVFNLAHFVAASGLDADVSVITDGRFSGTNKGGAVGHICPEAMEGGPIALLRDGDLITIDVENRRLDVNLAEEELASRARDWVPPEPRAKKGVLAAYARLVSSLSTGATVF